MSAKKISYIVYLVIINCFITNLFIFGQDQNTIEIFGVVECDNPKVLIDVNLFSGNNHIDKKQFPSNSTYSFKITTEHEYHILFSGKGYITQKVIINTQIPQNKKSELWKLECNIGLFADESKKLPANTEYLIAKYQFKETSDGGTFDFAPDSPTDIENVTSQGKIHDDHKSLDQTVNELLSDDILKQYSEDEILYSKSDEFKKTKKELVALEKLKKKTKTDSIQLLEKSLLLKRTVLSGIKNQLQLEKLNAKTKSDSLKILEKEKMIAYAEQDVENARKNIQLKNYELKSQRVLIFSALGGLLLLIVIIIIMYSNFKIKLKLSKKLEAQNEELENQRKDLEYAFNKLIDKNTEINAQKDEIELKNQQITSSIYYAKHIQEAMLPKIDKIKELFPESFILFLPKDIVSGDFYWMEQLNNSIYFAVVDCTGHGVPGAFMSIVGNRLLNEILFEKRVYKPGNMLELLNIGVKDALKQDQTDNNDGMDVCLGQLEFLTNNKTRIVFSGAKRPLFYFNSETGHVNIIKGNRKPIGGLYYQHLVFDEVEIILKKGDILYLTSDGFMDQNAPSGKKLGTSKFMQILQKYSHLSVSEQKIELEREFETHKQTEEQRDDITIIGIRLH